ncbi:hypothetical protein N657DRAFT_693798 [Parathielavia appendiculata]|uniref:Uncharacterized protein n=1 Tax=Parathielavia appendiculata TaxID=2587402 RepID=A0AAN6TRG7_9PEZI|nr:hypothetical protein N657DRAFT_693798 [Parathielavia appendiculata]
MFDAIARDSDRSLDTPLTANEDKIRQAARYQDGLAGGPQMPLKAATLRKAGRGRASMKGSTREARKQHESGTRRRSGAKTKFMPRAAAHRFRASTGYFLDWCASAQLNIGTRHLPALVHYSRAHETSKSAFLDSFKTLFQVVLNPAGLDSAVLDVQANYKYISHRRRFTPFSGYCTLLRDTAAKPVIVYDAAKRRGWLMPMLSVLSHVAHAYVLDSVDGPTNDDALYVDGHAAATELITVLEPLGEQPVLSHTNGITSAAADHVLFFRQLLLSLLNSGTRNAADTVIICASIGKLITPSASATPRYCRQCDVLPEDSDYLAATVPCLDRIAHRRGSELPLAPIVDNNSSTNHVVIRPGEKWNHIRISDDSFWELRGDPFAVCRHAGAGGKTCREREDLIVCVMSRSAFDTVVREMKVLDKVKEKGPVVALTCLEQSIPPFGAPVFGR